MVPGAASLDRGRRRKVQDLGREGEAQALAQSLHLPSPVRDQVLVAHRDDPGVLLAASTGFDVLDYLELQCPPDLEGTPYMSPSAWGKRWPYEQVWKLRKR